MGVFCVRISFILLLIKWSEMDLNVKSQTLVETFDQANFNSIPEYMHIALITLLTCPVSTCTAKHSFSSMKRLQTLTKNHDRQEIEFSCNSAYEHKDIIDIDSITDYIYQYLIADEINAQGCGGGVHFKTCYCQ